MPSQCVLVLSACPKAVRNLNWWGCLPNEPLPSSEGWSCPKQNSAGRLTCLQASWPLPTIPWGKCPCDSSINTEQGKLREWMSASAAGSLWVVRNDKELPSQWKVFLLSEKHLHLWIPIRWDVLWMSVRCRKQKENIQKHLGTLWDRRGRREKEGEKIAFWNFKHECLSAPTISWTLNSHVEESSHMNVWKGIFTGELGCYSMLPHSLSLLPLFSIIP